MGLPRKLYGRLAEMEMLRTAFQDASHGQQIAVFINGYAGMGKTALVYEAIRSLDLKDGHFIAGKSDQLRQNIPYAPIAVALSNLIRQLMMQSQEDLDRWRKRISRALGRNGKVITDIVPELKWIVGEQPETETIPPSEAQNRFRLVMRSFIGAVAGKDHPLVLFLDDLQWADSASIKLIQFLVRDAELPYLLLVGTYREIEAEENRVLMQMLETCDQPGAQERRMSVIPLNKEQVVQLTAEALHINAKCAGPLAIALHRKSGGNPFFFIQLLLSLHDEGLLYRNAIGDWEWDREAVQALLPGEDILIFLTEKLKRLPEETLSMLKLASCTGNCFDIDTLSLISGEPPNKVLFKVQPAIWEGTCTGKRDVFCH